MTYSGYQGYNLQFDPVTSRPNSRASSPTPYGAGGHSMSQGQHSQGQPVQQPHYHAPVSAASFGPAYYQRNQATDLGQSHNSAPRSYQQQPSYTYQLPQSSNNAAPASRFPTTGASNNQQPSSTYAPRGPHQPPRNSMEMVHDALDQWKSRLGEETHRLQQLEEEERRMEMEEATMRRRLSELNHQNRAIDQVMFATQDGWSRLYSKEHELRVQDQDPNNNEEKVLLDRLSRAEQHVAMTRAQHHEMENRSNQIRHDLNGLSHIEKTIRHQQDSLDAILKAFEQVERRRQAAKAKCDAYFDLEAHRERTAQRFIHQLSQEAIEDGQTLSSKPVPAPSQSLPPQLQSISRGPSNASAGPGAPLAPVRPEDNMMSDEDGANELDLLLGRGSAMDSVCLSVCTNTKKRRLESMSEGRQGSAPLSAY